MVVLSLLLACAGREPPPPPPPPPTPVAEAPERFVFGSCFDPSKPAPITQHVAGYEPDLLLFLGDNTYGSGVHLDPSMPSLQRAYAALAAHPDWQRLQALGLPSISIWDDHDYGSGDGGGDFALREQSEALFLEFWQVSDERTQRPGLYQAWSWGEAGERVQILVLDTRSFRAVLKPTDDKGAPGKERYLPDPDPSKTMLGEQQWSWLEAQLAQPADLRLVVSPIQVLSTSHGWESWNNLPLERQRLLELLDPHDEVVLLSGDRHTGQIYRDPTTGLVEVTASSWTSPAPSPPEEDPLRVGEPVRTTNFGLAVVDWQARQVVLSVVGEQGEPQVVEVVTLP